MGECEVAASFIVDGHAYFTEEHRSLGGFDGEKVLIRKGPPYILFGHQFSTRFLRNLPRGHVPLYSLSLPSLTNTLPPHAPSSYPARPQTSPPFPVGTQARVG